MENNFLEYATYIWITKKTTLKNRIKIVFEKSTSTVRQVPIFVGVTFSKKRCCICDPRGISMFYGIGLMCLQQCTMHFTLHSFIQKLFSATIDLKHSAMVKLLISKEIVDGNYIIFLLCSWWSHIPILLDCWNFINDNVDVNGRGLVLKSFIETIEIHMVSG